MRREQTQTAPHAVVQRTRFLRRLKWSAVILPALFALWSETVRHQFFEDAPILVGNIVTALLALASSYLVAVVIFHYIARLDADLVAQNRRLAALHALAEVAQAPTDEAVLLSRSMILLRDALGVRTVQFVPAPSDPATDPHVIRQPLRYGDSNLGTLVLIGAPPDLDRTLLSALGDALAGALANRRLRAENDRILMLEERDRIARELHDGLAQMLAAITLQSEQARSALSDGSVAAARRALARIEEASCSAYADVREAIVGLRVGMDVDLMTALAETAARFEDTTGITTVVSGVVPPDALAPSAELHVLRVVQECLTNVRKHAHASAVAIAVTAADGAIAIVIRDNGVGFDRARPPREGRQHFGLVIMQERVASLGGAMTVQSAPGCGATVRVTVPERVHESQGAA